MGGSRSHIWYSDLPTASPETWGDRRTCRSADWYNAKLIGDGVQPELTRTPDCHSRGPSHGSKMWVYSPDFNQVKYADRKVAINAGQDGAWWMAVNHVLLTGASS